MHWTVGAITNIRNNEKQIPFDLSAKNPEVGRLLMVRGEWVWLVGVVYLPTIIQLILEKGMGKRRIPTEYYIQGQYISNQENCPLNIIRICVSLLCISTVCGDHEVIDIFVMLKPGYTMVPTCIHFMFYPVHFGYKGVFHA